MKIKVIEEKSNEITLVLPKIHKDNNISDNELRDIAGGTNVLIGQTGWNTCSNCPS